MKVYTVYWETSFDYERDYEVKVFASANKAREFFNNKVEELKYEVRSERYGSLEIYDSDDYYNAYRENDCNDFSVYVVIEEITPIE